VRSIEIRAFRRDDRDQLTALVNAHVAACIPGVAVSVNMVMSQLEREPGETIVDPWVIERKTLVAVERDAIVAGALLHRHGDGEEVGPDYRNAGLIRWFVARRSPDEAADALMAGWADIGNLWVAEQHRRLGIASWLLGIAADWLRLGGIERLLAYAWPEQVDELAFDAHHGFRELARTERGWVRR
jgi:GNAT superfamily N-acetyltransferase